MQNPEETLVGRGSAWLVCLVGLFVSLLVSNTQNMTNKKFACHILTYGVSYILSY